MSRGAHCMEPLGSPTGLPSDVRDRERGRQGERSLGGENGSMSLPRSCLSSPPAGEPAPFLMADAGAILAGSGVEAAGCTGTRNRSIWAAEITGRWYYLPGCMGRAEKLECAVYLCG